MRDLTQRISENKDLVLMGFVSIISPASLTFY